MGFFLLQYICSEKKEFVFFVYTINMRQKSENEGKYPRLISSTLLKTKSGLILGCIITVIRIIHIIRIIRIIHNTQKWVRITEFRDMEILE